MNGQSLKFTSNIGFTIVELLVYIALAAIVSAAAMKTYVTNTQVCQSQRGLTEMFQDVRGAMQIMTREIRMAGCDPLGTNTGRTHTSDDYLGFLNNNNDLLDTDDNSIHFTHDSVSPSDGWAYSPNENIAYYYKTAGTVKTLYRFCTISNEEYLLSTNIKELKFEYFDSNGNVFTISNDIDRTRIRVVKITLTGQTEKPDILSKKLKEQTLTAYVRIRNLDL
ncbi:MAG: prepilin-type N-terminal cleavage/methylation domain-containing protein [Candidatus Magnetomorum sp.]|nr:prepilin-type N-terminal cleavage/methylation domain-containing protein [Candidatus Magnetomorum sp.]